MKRPEKIKVAFFVETLIRDYDGAIRTMYEIIDRIPQQEFAFLFITAIAPDEPFPFPVLTVPSIPLPMNGDYKMAFPFIVRNRVERRLNRFCPDLIHIATPSPLGHMGLHYGRDKDLPITTIYHTHYWSYLDYYLAGWPKLLPSARKHLSAVMQRFYNQCDRVYVPTREMERHLIEIGVFKSVLTMWKRGLRPNVFHPDKRDRSFICNLTGNNKPNLFYASRLVWEKNLKLLIEIYGELEQRAFPYNLIIAGTGYAEAELKTQMPEAFFLGHQSHDKLSVLYASSDVFVFPSISETYGNVVAEAMASGLPCVIADGGGSKEFIEHGDNGFLCSPHDVKSYLRYIDLILNNSDLKTRITQRAIKSTQNLCWEILVQEYFKNIRDLTQKHYLKSA